MGRVRIDMPEKIVFETDMPVRITDINYGGHVGNDRFLGLAHEARVLFLSSLGYTEKDIAGEALILADAAVVYKSQVFYGQTLRVEIAVDSFSAHGCSMYYRMTNKDTGQVAVLAKTGIVFLDYDTGKLGKVPEDFRSKFS